jgi:hypothetical protein
MRASPSSRTPLEILVHMGDLVAWGERMVRGDRTWAHEPSRDWAGAHARFFDGLAALDRALAEIDLEADTAGRVFSGPVADALTHTGQISFLRGIAGSAVRPENYARAEVRIGHVGPDQPTPRAEYDGDASRPRPEG